MTTYIGTQIIAQWVGVFVLKCLNHFLYCNPNCNSVSRCVDAKCLTSYIVWTITTYIGTQIIAWWVCV